MEPMRARGDTKTGVLSCILEKSLVISDLNSKHTWDRLRTSSRQIGQRSSVCPGLTHSPYVPLGREDIMSAGVPRGFTSPKRVESDNKPSYDISISSSRYTQAPKLVSKRRITGMNMVTHHIVTGVAPAIIWRQAPAREVDPDHVGRDVRSKAASTPEATIEWCALLRPTFH